MNRTAARIVIAVAVAGAIGIVIDAALRGGPAPDPGTAAPIPAPVEPAPEQPDLGRAGAFKPPPPEGRVSDLREVVTGPPPTPPMSAPESLVPLGLRWMKDHQSQDGSWHDPATTGVSILVFLGAGHTTQHGSFRESVRKGLKYLRDVQADDGCLAPRDSPHVLHDHAIAALALVEAYGMTNSRVFKDPAERAVAFALKSRTPSSGWGANGLLDVETTGWMSMLVKSAKLCEFDVDVAVLDDAVRAIDQVTDHQTGRVTAPGGALPDATATAISIVVRAFAGHDPKNDEMMRKGAEVLAAKMPTWTDGATPDHSYLYFGTIGISHARSDRLKPWRDAVQATVEAGRVTDEASADLGSWSPPGASSSARDRVWSTAFNLLCAEWYGYGGYRHALTRR